MWRRPAFDPQLKKHAVDFAELTFLHSAFSFCPSWWLMTQLASFWPCLRQCSPSCWGLPSRFQRLCVKISLNLRQGLPCHLCPFFSQPYSTNFGNPGVLQPDAMTYPPNFHRTQRNTLVSFEISLNSIGFFHPAKGNKWSKQRFGMVFQCNPLVKDLTFVRFRLSSIGPFTGLRGNFTLSYKPMHGFYGLLLGFQMDKWIESPPKHFSDAQRYHWHMKGPGPRSEC